jgi:hypothetical protein
MKFTDHEIDIETLEDLQECDGVETDDFLTGDTDNKGLPKGLTILPFDDAVLDGRYPKSQCSYISCRMPGH